MSAVAAARMEELYTRVLAPLVLGGELHPVRPIGPSLAREMGELASVFVPADDQLARRVDDVRASRARALLAVERAPALEGGDVLLLAALNDLLQVANPYLRSALSAQRPRALLLATESALAGALPPADVLAAVGRHALFASVLSLTRSDTAVRWWSGAAVFRGEDPPARLLAWPSVRRVRVEETLSTVRDLAAHTDIGDERFLRVLSQLLGLSPLTDLATAHRDVPPFRWTSASLSLVRSPLGAATARRAMTAGGGRAELAVESATRALEEGEARAGAEAFLALRRAHAALSP